MSDLTVSYWLLGQKGRRFGSLEQAWELRELAGHEHVDILGFNRDGKLVVKAPGQSECREWAIHICRQCAAALGETRAAIKLKNCPDCGAATIPVEDVTEIVLMVEGCEL